MENWFFVGVPRTTGRHKMVAAMWKWSSQRARFLVGRQSVRVFVSAAACVPKLFAPTGRYASLIAHAVNKRGAEKERKELLRAISWPRRKVVPSTWPFEKSSTRGKTFHSGTFFTIGQVGSQDYSWRTTMYGCKSGRNATNRVSPCSLLQYFSLIIILLGVIFMYKKNRDE